MVDGGKERKTERKKERKKEKKEEKDRLNECAVPVAPSPPGDISVTHPGKQIRKIR